MEQEKEGIHNGLKTNIFLPFTLNLIFGVSVTVSSRGRVSSFFSSTVTLSG
jgi:hypothetical protein